ncbi:speriolin isoform X1 [Mauremys reevesii]|uniref:speriolin isoform X1 n=1 Tax=Mauremys reevesii TaxID=260615 RepID=UPI00193F81A0|nr:speriolin isoform X1 [Mauremys reevesii]
MASLPGASPFSPGMAVISCYERLRMEIQALITENKELRKLVDLMKENQDLKNVLRNQSLGGEMSLSTLASTRSSEREQSGILGPGQAALGDSAVAGGPAAGSPLFRQSTSMLWDDSIEEGPLSSNLFGSGSKTPSRASKTSLSKHSSQTSEGQVSEARARTPESSYRSSTDSSKKYMHTRLPSSVNFKASTDSVPHSASPWDTTLNDTVFSDDMPLLPQSAISPASRAAPVSFQMPPTPQDPQRPPDVRPKEMTRKVFRATDRPQTQGATSKPNLVKDHNQLTWERIVGEIAFQLDRRILSSIFPERVRLYGFTVNNIPEKIIQASTNTLSNQVDEQQCTAMTRRYLEIMNRLKAAGYNPCMHPSFTEYIVNTYGILRERPELAASESGSYNNVDFLRKVVMETVPDAVRDSALILLECLAQLAKDDGKPMFIW